MALPPAIIVTLSPSMTEVGTRIGMAFWVGSIGVLIGSPIAGAILNGQSRRDQAGHFVLGEASFSGVLAFTGAILVASGGLIGVARVSKVGWAFAKA